LKEVGSSAVQPKTLHPRQSLDTCNPDLPSALVSMLLTFSQLRSWRDSAALQGTYHLTARKRLRVKSRL
jgi:hypothetical protein